MKLIPFVLRDYQKVVYIDPAAVVSIEEMRYKPGSILEDDRWTAIRVTNNNEWQVDQPIAEVAEAINGAHKPMATYIALVLAGLLVLCAAVVAMTVAGIHAPFLFSALGYAYGTAVVVYGVKKGVIRL